MGARKRPGRQAVTVQAARRPTLTNPHSSRRMFDILQEAELSHHLAGKTRREYLLGRRAAHVGQVRREIDRITGLGEEGCDLFFRYFLEQYGVK